VSDGDDESRGLSLLPPTVVGALRGMNWLWLPGGVVVETAVTHNAGISKSLEEGEWY